MHENNFITYLSVPSEYSEVVLLSHVAVIPTTSNVNHVHKYVNTVWVFFSTIPITYIVGEMKHS